MSRFAAIDLSALAAPPVIEVLDYEDEILIKLVQDFIARLAAMDIDYDVAVLESDPAKKVLEVAAYRELILRARVNDAARAVLIPFAKGGDLDVLASYYGVTRLVITPASGDTPAVMESDTALRARTQMAPEAFASAGTEEAYRFHTLTVSGLIKDVNVFSPAPGQAHVVFMTSAGSGIPEPALVEQVRARLTQKDIKPLTDMLTVKPMALKMYAVEAELVIEDGPDATVVIAAARAAAQAYVAKCHKIGVTLRKSGLIAALKQTGVEDVRVFTPAADVVQTREQAPYATAITVRGAPKF